LQLTVAGTGDIGAFQERAQQLGVSANVYFHGWATQDQVAQLLGQADALVLPSHDEGLPLAILEALAHGVAVVCTPVGEIPHVLSHGHTACFVEPGEPSSIARGLAMVLRDTQLRERLERKGKALHEAQFSLQHFAASIARIHKHQFGLSALLPAAVEEQR
jgi:glycosyltransferase involved in cell wall biosynthesis